MKKNLLLLLCAFACTFSLNAQQVWFTDFEEGFEDITLVDNDGNTPAPNVGAVNDAWIITEDNDKGLVAVSTSWYTPAGAADDWLITPAVEIPEEGYLFVLEARAFSAAYSDGYEILVSTSGPELANFVEIGTVAAENTTWTKRKFELDAYAGQTIHVAVRNASVDKWLLFVDNLEIVKLKERNVTAMGTNNNRWNDLGDEFAPVVVLTNNGGVPLTSVDVEFTLDGQTYTESFTGLNVETFGVEELQLTQNVSMAAARQYSVEYTLTNPNEGVDDDMTDNDNFGNVFALGADNIPARTVVGEEGTGTWCPWCPRGEVNLKAAIENNPDDFIGIAVHNGDPMTIAEYDDEIGFSAYPSMHLNREIRNFDPADIQPNLAPAQQLLNSMTVSMDNFNYDETTREVTFTATGISTIDMDNEDFNFAFVITEDDLSGTTSDWAQANAYANNQNGPMGGYENLPNPVPASQMFYDHVAVELVGGFYGIDGSTPDVKTANQPFTYDMSYTLTDGIVPEKATFITMLLDAETGFIMNADKEYIKTPVNIFETPAEIATKIYPNPATDMAQVEVNLESLTDVNITVIDVTGKIVAQRDYSKMQGNQIFPINVNNFNNGMYLVQITTENGASTQRLTVAK